MYKTSKEKFDEVCGFEPSFAVAPPRLENLTFEFSADDGRFCNHTGSFVPNRDYDEWFLETNIFCQVNAVGMSRDFYGDGFAKDLKNS